MKSLSQIPFPSDLQELSGGPAAAAGVIRKVTAVSAGVERHGPGPTPGELEMVRTRQAATLLAVALVKDPFAPETAAAVRQYLSGAEAAGQAFAELQQLPEQDVRDRIAQLQQLGEETRS
jgi:hypothetical protein